MEEEHGWRRRSADGWRRRSKGGGGARVEEEHEWPSMRTQGRVGHRMWFAFLRIIIIIIIIIIVRTARSARTRVHNKQSTNPQTTILDLAS